MKMINDNLSDYVRNIDNLRHLVRYQTAPRVASESVAEHSFFVAAYVLKLHDYYDFNLEKALKMAILHDFSEVYISDVPHPIKVKFPDVDNVLTNAEYNVNKEHISEEFAEMLKEFNDRTSPEGCAVALADIMSVLSYAKYEIELGNSKYMQNVYKDTKERYINLIYMMKDFQIDKSRDMVKFTIDFLKK